MGDYKKRLGEEAVWPVILFLVRPSILAQVISVANTLPVAPLASATVKTGFPSLFAAVTAEEFIEAMAHIVPKPKPRKAIHRRGHAVALDYMSPAALDMIEHFLLPEPHHMWLWMEYEEVKCMVGAYERGEVSAAWANLNIRRILWYGQHTRATDALNPVGAQDERDAHADLTRALEKLHHPHGQALHVLPRGVPDSRSPSPQSPRKKRRRLL